MRRLIIGSVLGLIAFLVALVAMAATPATEHLASATVLVKVSTGPLSGHGSGVHLGGGYILTANHVVEGESKIEVETSDGRKLKPEILWTNKKYDLALIKVFNGDGIASRDLRCTEARMGERVFSIGNPLNLLWVTLSGFVAGPPMKIDGFDTLIIPLDMTIAGGMSGGPLIDDKGRILGIIVAGYRAAPIGIAISGVDACRLMGRVA